MHIDSYSFEKTASAIMKLNPHAREKFADKQELIDFMVSFAYRELATANSYGGTCGFIISTYTRPDGKERGAYASVLGGLADDCPIALAFA